MKKLFSLIIAIIFILSAFATFIVFVPTFANATTLNYAYPIVITNNINADKVMTANWDYPLTISYNSSSGLNGNFSNIRFSLDSGGQIELYAWLQSYTTTEFNVWILLNQTLDIGASLTIYYQIEAANINYGPHWGLSPVLGQSIYGVYGEYDNGATVFPFIYENFTGTSLPTGWGTEISGSGNYTIDNGLTLTTGSTVGNSFAYNTALFNETSYQMFTYLNSYINTGGSNSADTGFSATETYYSTTTVNTVQSTTSNSSSVGYMNYNTSAAELASTPSLGNNENSLITNSLYTNYTTDIMTAVYMSGYVFSSGNSLGNQYTETSFFNNVSVENSTDIGSTLGYLVIGLPNGENTTTYSINYTFVIPSLSLMPDSSGVMADSALSYTIMPEIYFLTFQKTNLATGILWGVELFFPNGTNEILNTTTNIIIFSGLSNATYTYSAFTDNYNSINGSAIINGNNDLISITFGYPIPSYTYIITITNSASADKAMTSNWDYPLTIPYNSSSGLNGNFSNIRFSLDSGGQIELYAWLQSYNATAFNVWILINQTLNIGGSLNIYYQIEVANINYGPHWGLSPVLGQSLLGTYGKSDNGMSVFPIYNNFVGVTLPSGWIAQISGTGTYNQNNGITLSVGANSFGFSGVVYNTPLNETAYQTYTYATSYINNGGISGAETGFSSSNDTANIGNSSTAVYTQQNTTSNSNAYGLMTYNTTSNIQTNVALNLNPDNTISMSSLYTNYSISYTTMNAIYAIGNVFSTGNSLGIQYTGGTIANDVVGLPSNVIGSTLGYPVVQVASGAYATSYNVQYMFVVPSLSLMPDPLGFVDFQALTYTITSLNNSFTLTFQETGLPLGTQWYIQLFFPSGIYETLFSNSNIIMFTGLSNFKYIYSAFSTGYTTISGNIGLNNQNKTILLTFSTTILLNGIYTLTVFTNGINYGVSWTLNITDTINNGYISFGINTPNFESDDWANGTYIYTAYANGYVVISGSFSINGNDTTVIISFVPIYQNTNTTTNNTTLNVDITIGILIVVLIVMVIGAYFGGAVTGIMMSFIVLLIGRILGFIPTWIIIAAVVVASASIAFKVFLGSKGKSEEE